MMKIDFKSVVAPFKRDWGLKIAAVLIAIGIWFLIVQYVNPEDTRKLENIPIQVVTEDSVPEAEGLILVDDFNKSLSITYEASRDVIAVLNTSKITAVVDLSSVTKAGEYTLPVKIETGGQNINVTNQSVKEVTLTFEKSMTAQVKINVVAEGTVPDGYIKNEPICSPNVLSIEGPESLIKKIVSAEAKVDETEFVETSVYTCDYTFVDSEGNVVDDRLIISDYETVNVTVSILKTKSIPVTATIVNTSGGNESNFASVTITPSEITVAGGEDTLDTLNSYDLGTIDVSEKNEDFKEDYVISLQNGLKNIDGISKVTIDVSYGDIRTQKLKFTNFEIQNLAKGQKATVVDEELEVTFRGISDDIAKINSSNVKLVVDFQNKVQSEGKNSVAVYAVIDEDYKVGVVGKYYLTVNIS